MIVSAYSFADLEPAPRDPTRMAAQVVSGIGFLGAGVIIFRKNAVRGLTTAASIWAVSGLGLAAGGGLYAVAGLATAFILVIQVGLRPWSAGSSRTTSSTASSCACNGVPAASPRWSRPSPSPACARAGCASARRAAARRIGSSSTSAPSAT